MTQPRRELDTNHEWYPKGSLPEDNAVEGEVVVPTEVLCRSPHLGIASTQELLQELSIRGRMEQRYQATGLELCNTANVLIGRLPNSMLRHRTVDG